MRIARSCNGEIINADPQQFNRGMDIGTAKPSRDERALVQHHLLDIADPHERIGLALFQRRALRALEETWDRGKLPILVGGSGQYVWGLLEGWTVPEVPPDLDLRAGLEARAAAEGTAAIHAELVDVDPEAAARIHVNDLRRIVRALEVFKRTGRPISSCQLRKPLDADVLVIGVDVALAELDSRISMRTDLMLRSGLIQETLRLLDAGYTRDLPALRAIGYREAAAFVEGELTLTEAQSLIERETRRLARRQKAWFKPADPRVNWLTPDAHDEAVSLVVGRLGIRLPV